MKRKNEREKRKRKKTKTMKEEEQRHHIREEKGKKWDGRREKPVV